MRLKEMKMKTNFEKLFVKELAAAGKPFSIAKKNYLEEKERYGECLEQFIRKYVYVDNQEFGKGYTDIIRFFIEGEMDHMAGFPFEHFHKTEVFEEMIFGHINAIENDDLPDITPGSSALELS